MSERRFARYGAYKESGVEWLGEIPVGWEVARIAELATVLNGYPFDSQFFTNGDGIPLVRIRDLTSDRTEVNFVGAPVESAWIENDDVLIGMDGDFNVARWKGERALLNQRMCCVRPRGDTDSRFVAYVLPLPLQVINDLTYATTVKHLASGDIRKIRLGAPPADEQRAIATFLDRETARIDALVAKKERLITLLQERRTARITRAVTKGLDPAAPMKDSGVEWLGEIPAHWEVKPNIQLFRQRDERGRTDLPILEVSIGSGVQIRQFSSTKIEQRADDLTAYKVAREGDIAFNKMRMWQGAVGRAPSNGLVSPDYVVAEPKQAANSTYFAALFRTSGYMAEVLRWSHGIVDDRNRLYWEEFKSIRSPVPPEAEQGSIVEFVLAETARHDALLARIRTAITHLHELRTALISAAVTGKIDVREGAE